MTDTSPSDGGARTLQVRDFYLGRQPIIDRRQSLFGYEMLFRRAEVAQAHIESDLSATATVIAHTAQLGLDRVIGAAQGFLNVDAAVLASDIFGFLPRDQVVLEIVETMAVTGHVLARIGELKRHGFRFALDDVRADSADLQALLPLVDYVKLDLRAIDPAQLGELAAGFRQAGKKLVAEKVESRAQFDSCMGLGFDYFQGYYFAQPSIVKGRKLSPSQLAVIDLMQLVMSDADNIEVERAVKRDASMALNLLRLVNTPAVGARRKIDSLSQAVTILGRRQLQRWLQIMLYAEGGQRTQGLTPLLMLATTRARMLELLASRLQPSQRVTADVAFTVGIMSLMDVLFGMPMGDIIDQIPVADEVGGALLRREGFFGDLLRLAEGLEQLESEGGEDLVMPVLGQLAISADELAEAEVDAFSWSEKVVRYAF
ncbi:MAG: EAL and HDOD domain-containing protein [Gammaproteobacteria bacterium]